MIAGIVANDPLALGAAYDHYAPGIYAYCWSLLSEPAEAADAVHDTFVIAAARLGRLRTPSRLRPWLYAVARNECRRQLWASREAATLDQDNVGPGEPTDSGGGLDDAELRELVQSALAGLSPDDREAVELSMRHGFYAADLTDVLGVPRNQAGALAARAHSRLESALGALLVTRSQQGSCAELAQILASSDGELTPAVREQVARHISGCDRCGERRRRELSPTALLGMLPVPELPPGLRDQMLSLVMDDSPDAAVLRGQLVRRAEPFARSGFPVPLDRLATAPGPARFIPAAGVLVAACVVIGGGAVLVANTLHRSGSPAVTALAPQVPSASAAPSASPPAAGQARSGRRSGAQLRHPQAGGTLAASTGTASPTAGTPRPSKSQKASPSPAKSPSHTPTPTPTPSPSRTPTSTPTPTPTPSQTPTPTPSQTPTPTPSSDPTPTPSGSDTATGPATAGSA
jgi:RNA polymerase sigma factor (sigma-70 family)